MEDGQAAKKSIKISHNRFDILSTLEEGVAGEQVASEENRVLRRWKWEKFNLRRGKPS